MLILEGKIEVGDYISVRNFLGDKPNFNKISGEVLLASQSGNLHEALKIGHLIGHLMLGIEALSDQPSVKRITGSSAIRAIDLANPRKKTSMLQWPEWAIKYSAISKR